jgi:hypothetical protein
LAVNLVFDGKSIAFVRSHSGPGFLTAPNQLDVSNSNTSNIVVVRGNVRECDNWFSEEVVGPSILQESACRIKPTDAVS